MKPLASILVVCCVLLLCAPAGADLTVGDAAPKLAQGKYVQGDPVTEFEKGKVYVVEMWATWCGPCIAAIPHVTELQKKYADKGLVVIGQNVWENDESKVEPFIKQMGEKMSYRVAMDDKTSSKKGMMAETWMDAAGQNGIPCSFIINQEGKIAWIGHPMSMDAALGSVIEGKLDLAKARNEHERNMAYRKVATELSRLARGGKWSDVLTKLDEIDKSDPKLSKRFDVRRFQALRETKQPEKAATLVEEVLDNAKDEPQTAIEIAEELMTAKDYARALKLVEAAAPHAKALAYWAYGIQARAHAERGDWPKAVDAQKKALETAPDMVKERMQPQLQEYERKVAAGK